MKHTSVIVGLGIICAVFTGFPALAQDWVSPYNHGATHFDFAELLFGPYSGSFSADGPAFGVQDTDPETFSESVGGLYVVADDTASVAGYAAARNPDDTVDLFVWWVRTHGEFVPAVAYPVDPFSMTTGFIYLDDIAEFDPPESFDPTSLMDWLGGVDAAHVFMAASGVVHLDFVGTQAITGTFSGTMLDDTLMVISVQNGLISLTGIDVATVPASWGDVKTLYR